jgi:hypothetical protein
MLLVESEPASVAFIRLRRRISDQDPAYEELKENDYGPRNEEIDKHRVYAIEIGRGNERPAKQHKTQAKDQYVELIPTE